MLTALAGSAGVVGGGVAIGGFDVVAYQTLPAGANGTLGSPLFAYNVTTGDATNTTGQRMEPTAYTFHFESASNLARFKADPWKYTPAWGGF